jgi:acetolactate synthase-1/2/3 large subunit
LQVLCFQLQAAAHTRPRQRQVQHASGIPSAIQDAWTKPFPHRLDQAISAPQGPVWIEVPQDVLLVSTVVPPVVDALAEPVDNPPHAELVAEAVSWLVRAERPVIVAGGGTRRGRAEPWLLSIAERLRAPVVCSPGGKGPFPGSTSSPCSLG